jgi:hypothetical protein
MDGIQDRFHLRRVVSLPSGDHDRQRARLALSAEVDLGRTSATRVADPPVT